MGDGWIFLKNLSALLFNDDLSNEPNFDWIHLAGQFYFFYILVTLSLKNHLVQSWKLLCFLGFFLTVSDKGTDPSPP